MRTKHKKGLQIHTSIATCVGRSEPARCGLCMCDDCRRKSNNNSAQNDDDGVDVDRAQEKKVRLLPNTRKDWQVLLYCQSENSSIRKKITYASKWLTLNNWQPFFTFLVRIFYTYCVCLCVRVTLVFGDVCAIHFHNFFLWLHAHCSVRLVHSGLRNFWIFCIYFQRDLPVSFPVIRIFVRVVVYGV